MIDEVGKFWIVERPISISVIQDILWESDIRDILTLTLGGFRGERIEGIYKSKQKATNHANKLLEERDSKRIGGGQETTNFRTNRLYF